MNLAKKLILPGAVMVAGAAGVMGSSLLSSLPANAAATTDSTGSMAATTAASTGNSSGSNAPSGPHQANGITETVLTGSDLTKATAAAEAAVPGGSVIRAETDADGAKYEVHMKKSDGTQVTVKLDANFSVTGTEDGMGAGGPSGSGNSPSSSSTN